jgi:GntR family transcriptional regulator
MKIHERVRERIEALIAERALGPGGRLPNETNLASTFGVSRSTVRNALDTLEQQGRVERVPGRGTIIREARLEQLLGKLTGFSEDIRLRGLEPSSRLIEAIQTSPSTLVKTMLRLDGETVWKIRRLRCANGKPIAIETCHVSSSLISEGDLATLSEGSLYDLLIKRGRAPAISEQSIEAMLPDPEEAILLEMDLKRPVLHFERLTFDASGTPIEFVVSTYRGDSYRVHVLLKR